MAHITLRGVVHWSDNIFMEDTHGSVLSPYCVP